MKKVRFSDFDTVRFFDPDSHVTPGSLRNAKQNTALVKQRWTNAGCHLLTPASYTRCQKFYNHYTAPTPKQDGGQSDVECPIQ